MPASACNRYGGAVADGIAAGAQSAKSVLCDNIPANRACFPTVPVPHRAGLMAER